MIPNQKNEGPSEHHSSMGRGMLYVGWVIVLAILVYIFGNWEKDQINPNRSLDTNYVGDTKEIVLERNNWGHYLLTAQVNGIDVDFLIDTGASHLVFTERQAEKIGLSRGLPFNVSTANGDIRVYSATVNQLRMGDLLLENVRASINPHMNGEALLGMSALANLSWEQRGNLLIIRSY